MARRSRFRHPRGLYVLFFAEMWERFSFYGMRALLMFYMTRHFLFSDQPAYAVYGSYTALVYATPAFGGLLADRLLGFRKAVIVGAVLMAFGHFAMAVDHLQVFYLALALLICGNGFFKPNISTIVGRLYAQDDPRRDGGFTIFYMGINLGAGAAPLICGYLGETHGWHYGFGLAGVGMVAGLVVFLAGQRLLANVAEPPDPAALRERIAPGISRESAVLLGTGAAVLVCWQLVQHSRAVLVLLVAVGLLMFGGLGHTLLVKCTRSERDRLLVVLVLMLASVVFWAFFEQAGSSINLFTDRNVDRELGSWTAPASMVQSVNPAYIILLAPLFAWLWLRLARAQREPSTPTKFTLGMLQLGLGFAALFVGASTADQRGLVSLGWLLLGYLLHTTGELCLSPVGLSMVTRLSPHRITGWVMGCWFLSTAYAQYIAGLIAMLTGVTAEGGAAARLPPPSETAMVYGAVFGKLALVAVGVSLVLGLFIPMLRRRMR
jgi:POT family proton-dependent oligopeptide transporter